MFTVEYFTTSSGRCPVKYFIFHQPRQTRNKLLEVIDYFQEFSFQLPTHYLKRLSGTNKLWELRIRYQKIHYRIFLAQINTSKAVLLHIITKKTNKTPIIDIKTALQRLEQY